MHTIIALGQHTQSNDVGLGMLSSSLDCTHGRTTLGMVILSSPLGTTRCRTSSVIKSHHFPHGRTTSSVAGHYRPWTAHTIGLRQAWHAIMDLGQHRLLDDVIRGNAIISLGMHTLLDYVGCSMPSSPLKSIHDRRHQAWHVVIAH